MVPAQMIIGEVLTVLNYGLWFLGLITFIAMVIALLYMLLFDWSLLIGENQGESSIYDPVPSVNGMYGEHLSTGEILDKCLTHRSQLKHWYTVLCERSGVIPGSRCPMDDLIGEAVFDGRQQYNCINAVDRAAQERKVEQHA